MAKKIFVSGCFDLLHSGHVTFFQNAARLGDLYVAVGSDRTVLNLKGHMPINGEEERLFMVKSIGCVKDAFISSGDGILDFAEELREIRPDIFIVNEDGDHPEKRELCRSLGVEYRVLQREPRFGLVPRSSTYYRTINTIPYGLSLAGAGLELPEIYALHPAGVVITLSLEPELICVSGASSVYVPMEDVRSELCAFHVIHWMGSKSPSPSYFCTGPLFTLYASLWAYVGRRTGRYVGTGYEQLPESTGYTVWRHHYEGLPGAFRLRERLHWSSRDLKRVLKLFGRWLRMSARNIVTGSRGQSA